MHILVETWGKMFLIDEMQWGVSRGGAPRVGAPKPFWLKPFWLNVALPRVHLFAVFSLFCIHVSRPRGWKFFDAGWVQVIRGPRPPSVRWPRVGQQQQAAQQNQKRVGLDLLGIHTLCLVARNGTASNSCTLTNVLLFYAISSEWKETFGNPLMAHKHHGGV